MHRRSFITHLGSLALAGPSLAKGNTPTHPLSDIKLALKIGMVGFGEGLEEKFLRIKEMGYDGIELDSPADTDLVAARKAAETTGLKIHGVVNTLHWKKPFSSASAEVRAEAAEGLHTAIRDIHALGGSSVLVVPGVVDDSTTHEEAWTRSLETISETLPLAAELGIHILFENVWNRMFYKEDAGDDQTADQLARYIDEYRSPWVGSYFDIGNHRRFGRPEEWIRTLGKRIVKLDAKDWGAEDGFTKLGSGDVDWPKVREALDEIGYTGWATAEVKGGDEKRCMEILSNMRTHLLGM